jgi:hypothetical protein
VGDPVDLFEFIRERARVMAVRDAVALMIAVDSKGTTGTEARVDAARIAATLATLGISERTVWRHVDVLVQAGWLTRTEPPTRGRRGQPGRKARYRLTAPGSDSSHDSNRNRVTPHCGSLSFETAPSRLTSGPESSATDHTPEWRSSPSDGSPSSVVQVGGLAQTATRASGDWPDPLAQPPPESWPLDEPPDEPPPPDPEREDKS